MVLLDSHAIIHRAYHALPDFASSKGVPTGALYGLTTMLLGIIEKFKPEYIVACYDLPEPTYRHIAYEAYKAGRKKTDDNLVEQLKSSRDIFNALGIPMYDLSGFEADDMLGTIVEQVMHTSAHPGLDDEGNPVKIVIASGDMDTMQLVEDDRVVVYTLKKGIKDTVVYDEKAVVDRFGFEPKLLTDYKGLRGDPSDNIIGIAGIGEKTASIIISTFNTIDEMYALYDTDPALFSSKLKAAKITDRIISLLEKGRDEAMFSKALATIRRDAPIDFTFEHAKWTPHMDRVETLFKELEFRSLVSKVRQVLSTGSKTETGAGQSAGGDNFSGMDELAQTEAEYNGTKKDDMLSAEEMTNVYADADDVLKEKLKLATWVLDSNKTNATLQDVYLATEETDAKKSFETLNAKIKEGNLQFVLDDIEIPLIPIAKDMTTHGVLLDVQYLKTLGETYHTELDKLEKEIHTLAGSEFNVASPKQLGEILYDVLGLGGAGSGKRIKKTAGGAKSTKESELEKLRDAHPIVGKILEYRELAKLLGTYIDVFPTLVDGENRLHAGFSQTGTTTGRMSSQDPNLQNIPTKTELGKKVRNAFVAAKGKKLVAIDYSQIELRIAAILSSDKNLVEIFKNGTDVHTGVAARVFKVDEKDVTKDMRRKAKVINFGILYGMGVNALRTNLTNGNEVASREDAQNFYSEYFNTFTGIATYLEDVKRSAANFGYTKTLFGRRRYFEGIKSKLPFIKAAAERMAINAPIQGTEADIIKIAMRDVYNQITSKPENETVLLMQIHDEVIFEIAEDKAESVSEKIKAIMEDSLRIAFAKYKESGLWDINAMDVTLGANSKDIQELKKKEIEENLKDVPIVVSVAIGDNWGEMK